MLTLRFRCYYYAFSFLIFRYFSRFRRATLIRRHYYYFAAIFALTPLRHAAITPLLLRYCHYAIAIDASHAIDIAYAMLRRRFAASAMLFMP